MDKNKEENDISEEFEETGEDTIDETELADVEERSEDALKKLRNQLKTCEQEKAKYLEEAQRAKADFLNTKRRLEEEYERKHVQNTIAHIQKLLPLADSFDMAMQDPAWKDCDEQWRKGVEGIYTQLKRIFEAYGVEKIDTKAAPFNPHEHEALSNTPVENEEEVDSVVEVVQPGYRMGDTIIRHAKVIVGSKEEKD